MNVYVVTDYSNFDDCDRQAIDVNNVVMVTQFSEEAYMYAVLMNIQNMAAMMEYDEDEYFDKDVRNQIKDSINIAWRDWKNCYDELKDASYDWRQQTGEYSDSRTFSWSYVTVYHFTPEASVEQSAALQGKQEMAKEKIKELLDLYYSD